MICSYRDHIKKISGSDISRAFGFFTAFAGKTIGQWGKAECGPGALNRGLASRPSKSANPPVLTMSSMTRLVDDID
jgi:hypothetical protein